MVTRPAGFAIRSTRDVLRGLVFATAGSGAIVLSHGYGIGSTTDMGPGYFPSLIGVLLVAFGLADVVRGLSSPAGGPIGRLAWRPLILLAAGVVGFSLLIDKYGLLLAVVVLVVCSLLARARLHPVEAVAITLVLCCIAGVLFVYGMGSPFSYLVPH